MYKVKTLIDLKTRLKTTSDTIFEKVPPRTAHNIRRGHFLKGIRDVNRIGWKLEEKAITEAQRLIEQKRWEKDNRFQHALERSQTLLQEVRRREEELQTSNEELQATTEELQTTNEELQSTNEELQATSEELERINAYNASLMGSMRDILMSTDTSGIITDVNPATERLSGYSHTELVGQPFRQFFTEPERAQAGIEKVLAEEEVKDYELTVVTKDGGHVPVSYNAVVLRDPTGQIIGVLGSARDITRHKKSEEEIRRLNEDLNLHAVQIEAANKELESFSYSVSHDLRAPLRAIDGFSGALLEDYSDKLDEEGKRLLNIIRSNTQKMAQLIDDLLNFSRISRQLAVLSDINMGELAKSVIEELKALAPERKLQFNIETLPPAYGDQALIREVFANLLSNAIKFTRPRETAVIEVGSRVEARENIYYVRDNGVGFDMKYVDKLFGVFQRLHSAEEFEGTGVGLAIVQRIIQRHDGRVWAEGKVNKGATFYFTLPGGEKV